MTDEKIKIPIWFWVVSIIMLLWNLMAINTFFQHITISEEALQAMALNERELYGAYPYWIKIDFGVAVLGGVLGSLGLLLRKKWAKTFLVISLIAVIVQMFFSLVIAKATDVYGPEAVIMPLIVILVSCFLVWFAHFSIKKNWIK